MKRATGFAALGAAGAAFVVAVAAGAELNVSAPGPAAAEDAPNILVIVTDDQRANSLGYMPKTKSWFGRGGRRYTRAIATNPVCCPSRASIFTGDYSHNHGVETNYDTEQLEHSETLQADLEAAGYQTYISGKFLNDWNLEQDPPFFTRWAIFADDSETANLYKGETWNVNGTVGEDPGYTTKLVGNYAVDFLEHSEQDDDRPWIMYVFPFAPHDPYRPQAKYKDADVGTWDGNPAVFESRRDKPPWVRSEQADLSDGRRIRRGQLRTLISVDDMVGKLMSNLVANDEGANTLAFYTSDNGIHWGEHGLKVKRFPYTPSLHVPMFVRWPDRFEGGASNSKLVANIDIAPTALEAAGQPVPGTVDGQSLFGGGSRDRMLLEGYKADRQSDELPDWAATLTTDYQYTEYYDPDSGALLFREYYDLEKDPFQLRNLLKDGKPDNNPDVDELGATLGDDRDCSGADCP